MIQIAPSLASAPLVNLELLIHTLEDSGADIIHFDIEDGCFVPEMNLGIRIIKELRPITNLPFDVHLMINNPEWIIPKIASMGVEMISVHYEACAYPRRTLNFINQFNIKAGLAFNPKTDIPDLEYCQPYLAYILILSTEPEVNNCDYLNSTLSKITEGKKQKTLASVQWEVDGGINEKNIIEVKEAGADIIVSGRGVFNNNQVKENMRVLREKLLQN